MPEPRENVIQGDCLEKMTYIEDHSVDMVLCDLPYGITQNRWDSVIPLDQLWCQYRRIIKPRGVVALTSQGLFTARLILSNEEWFRYKFVWVKSKSTNFLNARRQPLRQHEDICIFYDQQPDYHPVMWSHRKELIYSGFQPPFVIPPVQIRTCAANASGSCFESDAQTLIRIRVGCPYRRNV